MMAKLTGKYPLLHYGYISCMYRKLSYIACCITKEGRKEGKGTATERNRKGYNRRYPLCLNTQDVKYVLLSCPEVRIWRK